MTTGLERAMFLDYRPKEPASSTPLISESAMLLAGGLVHAFYAEFSSLPADERLVEYDCSCGVHSGNQLWRLPGDVLVPDLILHWVVYHFGELPREMWLFLASLEGVFHPVQPTEEYMRTPPS